jgi:hypothetical protein
MALFARVNMPRTKHHLVIERPFCAYERQSMVTLVPPRVLTQPYDQTSRLQKMYSIFLYYRNKIFFCVCCYGCEEKNNNKKILPQCYM